MVTVNPDGNARRRWHPLVIAVLLVCLAITGIGVVVASVLHDQTEQNLLDREVQAAGVVLAGAASNVGRPLTAAAELAEATDGDPEAFETVMGTEIDAERLVSAALLDTSGTVITVVGEPPALFEAGEDRIQSMIEQTVATLPLSVIDTLDLDVRRLGYGFRTQQDTARYVVYAESALPAERTSAPRPQGAFETLDYALYLGDDETDEALLYASTDDLPIDGRRSATTVPLGDSSLTLVARSDQRLGGWLSGSLWWLIAVGGTVFAIVAAVVTHLLIQRRRRAEDLAADVARLYAEQRDQADTLRRSLLPHVLPEVPGLTVAARYWPADQTAAIGGDFYDIFHVRDRTWAVVIGDVCGHGIEAASLTALTRHTVRAAARHVDDPIDVLRWTHEAIASLGADTYSTVCFGFLDLDPDLTHARLRLVLGGHPQPVVCHDGAASTVGVLGTVLGMVTPHVVETCHVLDHGDTIVLFTDGITDAPGDEAVAGDVLLRVVAASSPGGPEAVADALRAEVVGRRPNGTADDIAVLVLQLGSDTTATAVPAG